MSERKRYQMEIEVKMELVVHFLQEFIIVENFSKNETNVCLQTCLHWTTKHSRVQILLRARYLDEVVADASAKVYIL